MIISLELYIKKIVNEKIKNHYWNRNYIRFLKSVSTIIRILHICFNGKFVSNY